MVQTRSMAKATGSKIRGYNELKQRTSIIRTRAQKMRIVLEQHHKVLSNIDYFYHLNGHEPTDEEQPNLAAYIRRMRLYKMNDNLRHEMIIVTETRLPWFTWTVQKEITSTELAPVIPAESETLESEALESEALDSEALESEALESESAESAIADSAISESLIEAPPSKKMRYIQYMPLVFCIGYILCACIEPYMKPIYHTYMLNNLVRANTYLSH